MCIQFVDDSYFITLYTESIHINCNKCKHLNFVCTFDLKRTYFKERRIFYQDFTLLKLKLELHL